MNVSEINILHGNSQPKPLCERSIPHSYGQEYEPAARRRDTHLHVSSACIQATQKNKRNMSKLNKRLSKATTFNGK